MANLQTSPEVTKDNIVTLTNKTLTNPVINYTDTTITMNVKARAYLSANQNDLVNNTWTKVLLNAESYDVGGDFASYKFVAPVSGYYLITGAVVFLGPVDATRYAIAIYVDNAVRSQSLIHASGTTALLPNIVDILYIAANSYIELFAFSLSGGNTVDIEGSQQSTYMAVHLISV